MRGEWRDEKRMRKREVVVRRKRKIDLERHFEDWWGVGRRGGWVSEVESGTMVA